MTDITSQTQAALAAIAAAASLDALEAERLEALGKKGWVSLALQTLGGMSPDERTAAGHWGLFDHQADRKTRAAIAPTIAALSDLAETIADMRDRLLLEPFALHAEFLAARGVVSSSAVGEPKQARAWLDRLAQDEAV